MRAYWWIGLGFMGCQIAGDSGTEYNITARDIWDLQVVLENDTATAGQPLGLTVQMVSEDGDIQPTSTWVLTSDNEDRILYTVETVTATVAGIHVLNVTATLNERDYSAEASFTVGPGAPYTVDLAISDHGLIAGDTLDWSIQAADQWGNIIDATAVQPSVDSDVITVTDTTLTTTVPGVYTATATLGETRDSESFVVIPSAPAAIDLTLSNPNPELYETVKASVVVTDTFGNQTDDPWTLSVDGPGETDIFYENITFWDEGWYTVTAQVDGTSLTDSVGPFLIDTTGPILTIDQPERGDWIEGTASTASGNVTDDWSSISILTLNGTSVPPDTKGDFSKRMSWDFGINVLETYAEDSDGNSSTDTRAVIAGEFKEYGDEVENGLAIRIKQGIGGFDTLEALGEDLISATDLDALIPSPVFSDSYKRWGITWYSVKLYVTNPSLGPVSFDLDPRSTGVLRATVKVNDPELDWSANGTVAFISASGNGDITADDITVTMDLKPRVSGRTLYMDVDSVSTSLTNFDFDMDGWLYDVLDFFGVDTLISNLIKGYMEDAIEDAIYDEVPPILEDALSSLELGTDLEIMDQTYRLDAAPAAVSVDAYGMNLELASTFKAGVWRNRRTGLGSLYYGYGSPDYFPASGMNLGLSTDFLNQVMYALWGGGMLQQELVASDLGLNPADLEIFFPGLTELTIELDALLPPAVVPGTGAEMLDLQLGDVHLVLYNGDMSSGDVLLDVYFSAFMGMDMDATAETLTTSFGEPTVYFDVVYPKSNTTGAHDTEALLQELIPYLLPMLTDALGEIPMPAISGFSISGVKVNTDGPEDGFTMVRGNLIAE
jgi:hypothetical protein